MKVRVVADVEGDGMTLLKTFRDITIRARVLGLEPDPEMCITEIDWAYSDKGLTVQSLTAVARCEGEIEVKS